MSLRNLLRSRNDVQCASPGERVEALVAESVCVQAEQMQRVYDRPHHENEWSAKSLPPNSGGQHEDTRIAGESFARIVQRSLAHLCACANEKMHLAIVLDA